MDFFQNPAPNSGTLSSNTVPNPKGEVKVITTRSGLTYDGPPPPPTTSFLSKKVEKEPEFLMDPFPNSNERTF